MGRGLMHTLRRLALLFVVLGFAVGIVGGGTGATDVEFVVLGHTINHLDNALQARRNTPSSLV